MSRESSEWLNTNVLVGFGHQAWHFNAAAQGVESNHYPAAIPAADVARRLFSWTAVPEKIFTASGAAIPGMVANVRSDNGQPLGVVSERYAVHQFADSLLGGVEKITGSGLGISSAGLLKGGAVGWVSVSLADTTVTAEGVEFLPYLMAYGSHDGSLVTGYKRVVTNVVCDNTMSMALGESAGGAGYRIRHTRNSAIRVESAQQALRLIVEAGDTFAAQVKALCERSVSDVEWAAFVEAHVPLPKDDKTASRGLTLAWNKRDALRGLYRSDSRCAPWAGTAWGVVQTVNTYAHHVQTVKGTSRGERNMLNTLSGEWDTVDASTLATLARVQA